MTLDTLRKRFNQKIFNNPNATKVLNGVIDGYLNEAYQNFLILVLPFFRWRVNGEIADTNIVATQDEYPLPSDLLRVLKVYVDDVLLTDDQYEIFDRSIILLDETLYEESLEDGLTLKYQDEYTALLDSSNSPNIPTVFQPYLYVKASLDYCEDAPKLNDKYKKLSNRIEKEEAKITDHYSAKTNKPITLTPKEENYY